jgi:hypothetical protein
MEKFTEEPKCPKCGGKDIHLEYENSVTNYRVESLRCFCRKCRYAWHMEPKDSVKNEK